MFLKEIYFFFLSTATVTNQNVFVKLLKWQTRKAECTPTLKGKLLSWNYNMNRKSLVIYATQLAGGLLLKKLTYFENMLNIFELPRT